MRVYGWVVEEQSNLFFRCQSQENVVKLKKENSCLLPLSLFTHSVYHSHYSCFEIPDPWNKKMNFLLLSFLFAFFAPSRKEAKRNILTECTSLLLPHASCKYMLFLNEARCTSREKHKAFSQTFIYFFLKTFNINWKERGVEE